MKIALPKAVHSHTFYLLLAGNVVVVGLLGAFVLRPAMGALQRHSTEISKTKADIATAEQRVTELRKLKQTLPVYQSTYAPILQNVPKGKDIPGFQTELEDLAATTGNQLLSVDNATQTATKPGAPAGNAQSALTIQDGFIVTPYKLSLTGSFASILDMVDRLEAIDRFTKVTSLQLAGGDATGIVKATLEVQTLTLPQ